MLRFVILSLMLLTFSLGVYCKGEPSAPVTAESSVEKVVDVVCKMKIKPDDAMSSMHNGHRYHFCSDYCKEQFDANPAKYVK